MLTVSHGVSTRPLLEPLVMVRVPVSSAGPVPAWVASGEAARTVKVAAEPPGLVKSRAVTATLS